MTSLVNDPTPQDAAPDAAPDGGARGGTCGCGAGTAEPEIDVLTLPPALRHGMVFGALDAVPPGGALVLVAPHDPVPLLGQLAERRPGAFEVHYLERGPRSWRLRLARTA